MVPASLYEDVWPCGEGANKTRYLLDKCKDPRARELYLQMYHRVYGDDPDNKAFNQTFLCVCVYYFKDHPHKNKVNWTAAAAKVIEERQAHPSNNPMKLGPLALKLQLAGIIRECYLYFLECVGPEHIRSRDCGMWKVDGGGGEGRGDIGMQKVDGGGGDSVVQKLEELVAVVKKKTADLQGEAEALA